MRIAADNHRLTRILSRSISRCLRAPTTWSTASRALVALAGATILIGAQAIPRVDAPRSTETRIVASVSVPMPALHSVAVVRAAFAPRTPSRLPDLIGAALPAPQSDGLRAAETSLAITIGAVEQPRASIVARGYDATAPPALS